MPYKKINTPFSTVGYLTYKRTYARRTVGDKTEEYVDTIRRVVDASNYQLNCGFTEDESARFASYMLGLKGTVAGRFLWQLGTDTVYKLGLASLQNCAGVIVDEPVRPFTWAMDLLMLGSGVGYNLQKSNIDKLPKVRENFTPPTRQDNSSAEYIISDSREGWVALLGKTLKAAFLSSRIKPTFTYSTQLIRGKGAPIKGFGGTASGPEDLCWGIEKISQVLYARRGMKIRPIDALDIMNIIGAVVVAGNVRRSAQLAIGDCDDIEYLNAKRWDLGNLPSWRAMSNNSVACNDVSDLPEEFWEGYKGNGEPYGLINIDLSRKIGRIGETQYPDKGVSVYNPCFRGDMKLLTTDGYQRLDSLVGKEFKNINASGNNTEGKVWSNGVKKIVEIKFSGRSSIFCTPDHIFMLKTGEDCMAKDLNGRVLMPQFYGDICASERIFPKVSSVVDAGEAEVFDFTEPETHWGFVEGVVAHNCAEQSLENHETCCLAEIFLPNIISFEEMLDVTKLLYRVCKHSLALPCHLQETEDIVHRNMRMGIGITGVLQASKEQLSWLDKVYILLREYDVEYSEDNGFPPSIKLTTLKPSGSLSLLPGVTPGIHPAYAQYMIRRIRIMSDHPLVAVCKQHGYPVEYQENFDGTIDHSTVVVSFPYSYPEGTILAENTTAIQQLEYVKNMQRVWSDNAVSCTVYYRLEELDGIKEYLRENYKDNHKSLSFMLHNEHGFKQAPFEAVSKEVFDKLVASTKLITSIDSAEFEGVDECAGGVCPVR